ncbi:hypothetical protein PG997_012384 [Apiospora hydei]|uniref:Uncharacterized protein n=1 Tax=Apiospora hydei TaxID=1337664 RepID=A0ABR1V3A8_9PEZI
MANPDAPRKVMRCPAASIPPRAARAQNDPISTPMAAREHRRWMAQRQQQIGPTCFVLPGCCSYRLIYIIAEAPIYQPIAIATSADRVELAAAAPDLQRMDAA